MFGFAKIAILMIVLLSPLQLSAETLLFYDGNSPFSQPAGAPPQGLNFDIVTAIFDDMGIQYDIKSSPFKRSLRLAYEGQGIVVGILKTDERSEYLDYSHSIYDSRVVLFTHKDRTFPFSSIADLKGKTIATKLGWSYGTEFDSARQRAEFSTIDGDAERHFNLVSEGKVDAVIDNYISGIYTINKLNMTDKVQPLPYTIDKGPHYLGVKKNTRSELIKQFNQRLKTFKSDGRYEKILAKYL